MALADGLVKLSEAVLALNAPAVQNLMPGPQVAMLACIKHRGNAYVFYDNRLHRTDASGTLCQVLEVNRVCICPLLLSSQR